MYSGKIIGAVVLVFERANWVVVRDEKSSETLLH